MASPFSFSNSGYLNLFDSQAYLNTSCGHGDRHRGVLLKLKIRAKNAVLNPIHSRKIDLCRKAMFLVLVKALYYHDFPDSSRYLLENKLQGNIKLILTSFFMVLQLPRAIYILENRYPISGTPEHVMAIRAFEHLLQFTPLLDDVDLKCRFL